MKQSKIRVINATNFGPVKEDKEGYRDCEESLGLLLAKYIDKYDKKRKFKVLVWKIEDGLRNEIEKILSFGTLLKWYKQDYGSFDKKTFLQNTEDDNKGKLLDAVHSFSRKIDNPMSRSID